MNPTPTFFDRVTRLFRRNNSTNGNGGGNGDGNLATMTEGDPGRSVSVETRPAVLRSWGKNGAAIAQLQEGFQLLTELMTTIRSNMESQGHRQDQLLEQVSALPKVLESIPETTRIQGEALKAIHQQLIGQAEQQSLLRDILDKLAETGGDQRDLLEGIRERMETLHHQDQAMADSLNTVGSALESVSRNSASSAQILGSIRDNLSSHDRELEQVLRRQASRFTLMLATSVILSGIAVLSVVVMGFMFLHVGK
jgi:hypothetical protein